MSSIRTYRERVVAPAMVFGGLLLLPWILYLAGALPHSTRARNWSLMWTGLDIAEALGLMLTGILLWRRSHHLVLPAAFTSALLAADAWIDVTTSAPGHARALAITMAAMVEVPGAIACLVLSIRAFPRNPARADHIPAGADHILARADRIPAGADHEPADADGSRSPLRAVKLPASDVPQASEASARR